MFMRSEIHDDRCVVIRNVIPNSVPPFKIVKVPQKFPVLLSIPPCLYKHVT